MVRPGAAWDHGSLPASRARIDLLVVAPGLNSDGSIIPTAIYDPVFCLKTTVDLAETLGLDPGRIVFEVVESEQVTDEVHLRGIVDYYRSRGFGVALDDVGSGYSSLNLLVALHPDVIKVDQKIIRGIDREVPNQAVFRALSGIARDMGAQLLAIEACSPLTPRPEHEGLGQRSHCSCPEVASPVQRPYLRPMSFIQLFQKNGANGFGPATTAEKVTEGLSLSGKTILVTGCNSGLGEETLRVLALRGARVVGTARTLAKAQEACQRYGSQHIAVACELSDPSSVRAAVADLHQKGLQFDAIIANAGIMALPKLETAHGYDLQFYTNHIGHFQLVTGILDLLADAGRVVILSSSAHSMAPPAGIDFDNLKGEKTYSAWGNYGQSKFANLLFAKELARRFQGTKKTANAVHPGVIQTKLSRNMNPAARFVFGLVSPLFLKSAAQGAATQVYVATHPGAASISGQYFADVNVAAARADSDDPAVAKKLWEVSEKIVADLA